MNDVPNTPPWWELHLRNARGQPLSDDERRFYEAELARQDREAAPLQRGLDSLKELREQVSVLADANSSLHARVTELNREIHAVEPSLSRETRAALGVAE